jgi:hypothetical protein
MTVRAQSRIAIPPTLVPLELPAAVLDDVARALPADVRLALDAYVRTAALQLVAHLAFACGWQRTTPRSRGRAHRAGRRSRSKPTHRRH